MTAEPLHYRNTTFDIYAHDPLVARYLFGSLTTKLSLSPYFPSFNSRTASFK